jgi:hypothetical protein
VQSETFMNSYCVVWKLTGCTTVLLLLWTLQIKIGQTSNKKCKNVWEGRHLSQQGINESMTTEHHLLYNKIDFLDDKTSEIGWHKRYFVLNVLPSTTVLKNHDFTLQNPPSLSNTSIQSSLVPKCPELFTYINTTAYPCQFCNSQRSWCLK